MSLAACPPVSTGGGFLQGSLAYFDCAGRTIGSAGFQGLAQPGSAITQLILTAITLFIAWQGLRMMFGRTSDMGDAVLAVAKIGLVVMLATSWPAVRTLFAEPVLAGPAELTDRTGVEGSMPLEDRLQHADDGMVALTKWGTGKLDIRVGSTADGKPAASEFAGIALTDSLALGFGRLAFLVGTLLSLGLLKLLAGVMISALPIFAGLLLFETARGLFWGWLRLLFALFVASFAVPLILAVELSLLEPWLATVIGQRAAFYATPSAPTEMLAITVSFLLILMGSIALLVRSCFAVDVPAIAARVIGRRDVGTTTGEVHQGPALLLSRVDRAAAPSRADQLALTLDRLDRPPRSLPAPQSFNANRTIGTDVSGPGARSRGLAPVRRRARQRTALSQARRNQI